MIIPMKSRRRRFSPFTNFMINWILTPLVVLLFVVYGVDGLLRLTDPLGLGRGVDDLTAISYFYRPDPRGYSLPPGTHHFSNWTVTINEDRTRLVPAANANATTTLTLIGDSVTFGLGVNDADTYANHLALHCPNVFIRNTAVSGYNINAIEKTFAVYGGADVYVYLAVFNDPLPDQGYMTSTRQQVSYVETYLGRALVQPRPVTPTPVDFDGYIRRVQTLVDTYPLLLFALNDDFGQRFKEAFPQATLLTFPTQTVSPVDKHPGAEGHEQLAREMLPLLADYGCKAMEAE